MLRITSLIPQGRILRRLEDPEESCPRQSTTIDRNSQAAEVNHDSFVMNARATILSAADSSPDLSSTDPHKRKNSRSTVGRRSGFIPRCPHLPISDSWDKPAPTPTTNEAITHQRARKGLPSSRLKTYPKKSHTNTIPVQIIVLAQFKQSIGKLAQSLP